MKTALIILLLGLTAQAATKKKLQPTPAATPAPAASKSKLSKDISFSGSSVDGKYLSAGDSIAEVEGDKEMGALIGIRKNFHDRLGAEQARLQAAQSGKGN